jgi:nucleoside 2-deoxyribosyltransferase
MLEGQASVEGEYVVYDPQSPIEPKFLDVKKSKVKNLALVLNGREAALLANSPNAAATDIAKKLFRLSGASAIVIKQGVKGASIFSGGKVSSVPAYKTDNVWKIGSGDVFASVFAHFWADKRNSAAVAARYASMAAARYCEFKAIPLTTNFKRHNYKPLTISDKFYRVSRPAVYLAGPFFTMTQRWLINEARQALKQQGLKVFSPMHDVGYGPADYVAPMDLDALKKCDVVFAITDGLDAGTIFEIGYANAKNIPIVTFVQNETKESLKMLEGSGCSICNDFTTAIYKSAWKGYSK